ncbi:hypothetical protein HanRHA438_Chr12g0542521 [Helianthus annuus]|nr:hypothetical protein HanRHA438_Chr12g0542521 [Helianthus annuus]
MVLTRRCVRDQRETRRSLGDRGGACGEMVGVVLDFVGESVGGVAVVLAWVMTMMIEDGDGGGTLYFNEIPVRTGVPFLLSFLFF